MSEIKVEKGISIPLKKSAKYPWNEMAVGDSFFVAGRSSYFPMKTCDAKGRKFTQRMVDGGLRVWRVA